MGINEIKFRTPDEMADILRNETDCLHYLSYIRWDGIPQCCQCHSTRISWYEKRQKYRCKDCRYFFTATTNTAFHSCKNVLRKYFRTLADFTLRDRNSYDVGDIRGLSQRIAWQFQTKTRKVLLNVNENIVLTGIVEIDESFFGGKPSSDLRLARKIWEWEREQDKIHGVPGYKRRKARDLKKRGRKTGGKNIPGGAPKISQRSVRTAYKNQIAVLGMKQRGGPEVYVVLGRGKSSVGLEEILPILQKYIDPSAIVISDDAVHYVKLNEYFPNHKKITKKLRDKETGKVKKYFDSETGEAGKCFCRWENIAGKRRMITVNGLEGKWGHMKGEYRGVYKSYTAEHMPGYLAEFAFRDKNNKSNCFQTRFNDLLKLMSANKITVNDIRKFTLIHDPTHDSKTKRRRVLRDIYEQLMIIFKQIIYQEQFVLIRKLIIIDYF